MSLLKKSCNSTIFCSSHFLHKPCTLDALIFSRSRCLSTSHGEKQQTQTQSKQRLDDDQFRVIELVKKRFERRPRSTYYENFFKQPREKSMPVDQDWGSVWPGIRSFHPASVPLPVRMGYPKKRSPFPDKWANAELMKIPNFLHLTPPVIERQCAAIKRFCTPWPKELESEEAQEYHFPVRVKSSSYLHSSPSIRDPRSRIVSLQVSLESVKLGRHAWDKMLRLVGDRFDKETKILTLVADRCPLSSQNMDYCMYLLTVLYNESLKTEPWEHEKTKLDLEMFNFEESKSQEVVQRIKESSDDSLPEEVVDEYSDAVHRIHNEGEDERTVQDYKNSVLKLLKLSQ